MRLRLERTERGERARVRVPSLSPHGRYLLQGLMGGTPGSSVDLNALERRLEELGLGAELGSALAELGHPVSPRPAERREGRKVASVARDAARSAAAAWSESWATTWIEGVIRAGVLSGLDQPAAIGIVNDVRRLLDRIADGRGGADRWSRVDLAATELGSAHALDWGTRLEAALTRAFVLAAADRGVPVSGRAAWHSAGVDLDVVSAPVLTWRLPILSSSGLAPLVSEAVMLGLPLHLTQLALRRQPVSISPGADVLVTENPRIVEAAAQVNSPLSVVSLNGNPTSAPRLLLDQLLQSGASLRYHGDFDVPGLRICLLMHHLGLRPWRMGVTDYRLGLDEADRAGVRLPEDAHRAPPTPWDPPLQEVFDRSRRILHEERDLDGLLTGR